MKPITSKKRRSPVAFLSWITLLIFIMSLVYSCFTFRSILQPTEGVTNSTFDVAIVCGNDGEWNIEGDVSYFYHVQIGVLLPDGWTVIDSIPFHEKILDENQRRLRTILKIMPRRKYRKVVNISRKHGGTPEYFVYDKLNRDFFFVAEHLDTAKKHWIHLVANTHKLCDVIVLR